METPQTALPKFKVKLDWKEYYKKFSQIHGGFPIVHKGRQLFGDGWGYSITDYQGPEYPPPQDQKELNRLQHIYWYIRWNRARNELQMIVSRRSVMQEMQLNKSAPLQQVIVEKDEETGKITQRTEDYDPNVYDWLVRWLEKEVNECDNKLKELKTQKEQLHQQITTATEETNGSTV